MTELRDYQHTALNLIKQSLTKGNKRPMLQASTGFGKTKIASHIIKSALSKGKRVIFSVPAISLIDQTVKSFADDGIHCVGVIQAQHEMTDSKQPVQVCSVQTLMRRSRLPDADLVLIDEAHIFFKWYAEWTLKWNNIPFIGLSATPWTKGLGKIFDDLVISTTTQQLIDDGHLCDFKVFSAYDPNLRSVKTVRGDYDEKQLADVMDREPLVADIVKTWKSKGEDRPTLVFCVNRAHAKHIQNQFIMSGIDAGYIDAYTDMKDRAIVEKKFTSGEIKVVCNVGCLTTGIDWDVRCIVLARPTKSEILFTQIIGRGLRTAKGKDYCLILDHSSTHKNLGFVTDIHHDTLDDGKPKKKSEAKKKEHLPKECSQCGFLKPAKVWVCPNCGFKGVKQSEIEVEKGSLKELKRKKINMSMTDKCNFYGELKHIAVERGYKSGWVDNQYRNKTGVWAVNDIKNSPMRKPSLDTVNFVKYQQIKWVKGQQARGISHG